MDSHQITETIIQNLTFPKHHEPRVKLQVWFELMNTFRKYGDPRVKHYDEDDIRDIAIRCVDHLVGDLIIKDCTDTNDQDEFEAQDSIVEVLTDTLPKYGQILSENNIDK